MSYAARLREVRACFELSQLELAPWLGLSRSHLGHIELGTDTLPLHARPWLRPWTTALLQLPPEAAPAALPELPPALPALTGPPPLLDRVVACRLEAERLRQRVVDLQARHRRWRRHVAVGPYLLAALPPVAAAESTDLARRRRWVARLVEAATDGLHPDAATGPTTEALLIARLYACQQEVRWLETFLTQEAPGAF
jgi:hypothetical protein